MNFSSSLDFAKKLDQQDSLASYREHFVVNDPNLIYLDGNSLGRLPKSVIEVTKKTVEEGWGTDLIRGWNKGWWESPSRIGNKIASLLGAADGQVVSVELAGVFEVGAELGHLSTGSVGGLLNAIRRRLAAGYGLIPVARVVMRAPGRFQLIQDAVGGGVSGSQEC